MGGEGASGDSGCPFPAQDAGQHGDDLVERPVLRIVERVDIVVVFPAHVELDAVHHSLLEGLGIGRVAQKFACRFGNGAMNAPAVRIVAINCGVVRIVVREGAGELSPCVGSLENCDRVLQDFVGKISRHRRVLLA